MGRNSEFGIRNSGSPSARAGYETLDVYQLAFAIAVELHKKTLRFDKIEQFGGIADQLRRASKSICANMAEGFSKRMSAADELKFLSFAIGSAEECRVWVAFCQELGYLAADEAQKYRDAFTRICQMLFKLQEKRRVAA